MTRIADAVSGLGARLDQPTLSVDGACQVQLHGPDNKVGADR
ncbi:hypothetical protein [Thiorhodovibrio frisius]|nr:hypothetical protein [Thiorhodovibrio frisius]